MEFAIIHFRVFMRCKSQTIGIKISLFFSTEMTRCMHYFILITHQCSFILTDMVLCINIQTILRNWDYVYILVYLDIHILTFLFWEFNSCILWFFCCLLQYMKCMIIFHSMIRNCLFLCWSPGCRTSIISWISHLGTE